MWFNDCILDKSGQIANPIIVKFDLYHIVVYAHAYILRSLLIAGTDFSDFTIDRFGRY